MSYITLNKPYAVYLMQHEILILPISVNPLRSWLWILCGVCDYIMMTGVDCGRSQCFCMSVECVSVTVGFRAQ